MSLRTRVALVVAVLGVASALAACGPGPTPSAQVTPVAPTAVPPAGEGTPTAAARGGVEVALATVAWPDGPAVARVNGVEVPTEAWRQEITRQLLLVTNQYQVDWNDKESLRRLPEFLSRELERMIDMELLRQAAAQENITVSEADVQAEIEGARQDILAGGQYSDVDAFLRANELTPDRFEAMAREQVMVKRLLAAHGGPSAVEQIRARHILLPDEEKAQEVQARLKAGESFTDLARAYSTDNGTKEQGGELGWLPRGWMVPEFDQAAFALQPGETSGAVKSNLGYHIIRVEERAVRELQEPMLSQVRQARFAEWLEGQRKTARIERLYVVSPGA